MRLHFISGLPRSGSTMLAAILRQNPRFHAAMTSPLATLFRAIEDATAGRQETSVFVTPQTRAAMLRGLFDAYYRDTAPETILDTSRLWCARLPLLAALFPEARMIVCVREIGWVLDSFELLYRRNGMAPSAIYNWDIGGTVFSRTSALAQAGGVVGFAINAVQEAAAGAERDRIVMVDYEALCKHPADQLAAIYDFLGEPRFRHDFAAVDYEAGEFDRQLGAVGLHTVGGAVEWRPRKTILPQALFDQFNGPNFWRA